MPQPFIPALAYTPLTRLYDVVVRATTRERAFKSALIAQADIPADARILDVGCGTGTLALLLKERVPSAVVTGIDADKAILAIARRKSAAAGVSVHFDEALSHALPYDDETFDSVISSLFFHHLAREGKVQTAQEMLRVLKAGGRCHIADWGRPTNWIMRLGFYGIQILDGFANTNDNVRGMLPGIFEEAGFAVVAVRRTFSTLFGTMALFSAEKRR